MNTPITVTEHQARTMLEAVRYTRALVNSFDQRDIDHDLPSAESLHTAELMLRAAIIRIRQREQEGTSA